VNREDVEKWCEKRKARNERRKEEEGKRKEERGAKKSWAIQKPELLSPSEE
jgi:hypothetical protein